MYKSSIYNIYIPYGEDVYVWNTSVCSITKLEKRYVELIEQEAFDNDDFKLLINDLLKQRIIVNKEKDEFLDILEKQHQERINSSSKQLSLIIAPTLNCNFNCFYCFERTQRQQGVMSSETVDKIVLFVEQFIEQNRSIEILSIKWFGGEPLLAFDKVISPLSVKLISLCKSKNIKYIAELVTNGYFLGVEVAKKLVCDYNVDRFQITLDGVEETTCIRKGIKKEDYRKVKDNMFNLAEMIEKHNDKAKIKLRLNIDKNNEKEIKSFLQEIKNDARFRSSISIYLGRLRCCTKTDLSLSEYENVNFQFELDNNIKATLPSPRKFWCSQYENNSFCIGPKGELYKCEHHFGDEGKVIGNVSCGVCGGDFYKKYIKMPISNKCKRCKLYPICLGGCPNERFNKQDVNCEYTEQYVIEKIKHYINIKENKNGNN